MKYFTVSLFLAASFLLVFSSFKKKNKPEKLLPKEFRKVFSYVPKHPINYETITINEEDGIARFISAHTVFSGNFYIYSKEVSNKNYLDFLIWLKSNKISEDSLEILRPDTTNWISDFKYQYYDPYSDLYAWHPAYWDYPAVNVSHQAALAYCKWLEDSLNRSSESIKFNVELPNHIQWVTAALGGISRNPHYAWGGYNLRDENGKFLANFQSTAMESVHTNPETGEIVILEEDSPSELSHPGEFRYPSIKKESYDVTAPVKSYCPNKFGIYNMSGNVAEMISESGIACGGGWRSTGFDIRCTSTMTYDSSQVDIGFRPIIKIVKE